MSWPLNPPPERPPAPPHWEPPPGWTPPPHLPPAPGAPPATSPLQRHRRLAAGTASFARGADSARRPSRWIAVVLLLVMLGSLGRVNGALLLPGISVMALGALALMRPRL